MIGFTNGRATAKINAIMKRKQETKITIKKKLNVRKRARASKRRKIVEDSKLTFWSRETKNLFAIISIIIASHRAFEYYGWRCDAIFFLSSFCVVACGMSFSAYKIMSKNVQFQHTHTRWPCASVKWLRRSISFSQLVYYSAWMWRGRKLCLGIIIKKKWETSKKWQSNILVVQQL